MSNIFQKAHDLGLVRPEYRGLSAKQLRERDPAHADRWAAFIEEHREEYVRAMSGLLGRREG